MQVTYKVLGGKAKDITLDARSTVGDLKEEVGLEKYTASVNGTPANDSTRLQDNDFVTLSEAVKGG